MGNLSRGFLGLQALALGSERQAEHKQWPGHSDRGPRALSHAWKHLEFIHSNLLPPKGESITLNRLRKGAHCQLRPKKGPRKPLVKSSFIPSPNPISLPLKLSSTQSPKARTQCPSNMLHGQEPYLAFPTHLSVQTRGPWCVQASSCASSAQPLFMLQRALRPHPLTSDLHAANPERNFPFPKQMPFLGQTVPFLKKTML